MQITIRELEPDDLAATQAIGRIVELEAPSLNPDPRLPVVVQLVACVGDRVIGYLGGDVELAPDPKTGEIVPVEPLRVKADRFTGRLTEREGSPAARRSRRRNG